MSAGICGKRLGLEEIFGSPSPAPSAKRSRCSRYGSPIRSPDFGLGSDDKVSILLRMFPSMDREGLAVEGGGEGEEEEELEWLLSKDSFLALETSFEIPSHSRSSSSGGTWSGGSAATAAIAGDRPNPLSVLAAASLYRVLVRSRSKAQRRKRRVLAALRLATAAREVKEWRRCRHCEAEETPQWRAGPEGPKTVCNACGVRYKSGRLVPEYRPEKREAATVKNFEKRNFSLRERGK